MSQLNENKGNQLIKYFLLKYKLSKTLKNNSKGWYTCIYAALLQRSPNMYLHYKYQINDWYVKNTFSYICLCTLHSTDDAIMLTIVQCSV